MNIRSICLAALLSTCAVVSAQAAKIVPVMFHDPEVVKRMKDSGSPMLIMDRAQVLEMFQKKQETLKALLSDLRK